MKDTFDLAGLASVLEPMKVLVSTEKLMLVGGSLAKNYKNQGD